MAAPEDVRFAKVVLKQGWASKEDLEKALASVKKLRAGGRQVALPGYLKAKGLLSAQKVNKALQLLRSSGGGTARSSGLPGDPGVRSQGKATQGSSYVGRSTTRRGRGRYKRKKNSQAPIAVLCGASLLVVGLGVYLVVGPKGSSLEGEAHTGRNSKSAEPAAQEFVSTVSPSGDSSYGGSGETAAQAGKGESTVSSRKALESRRIEQIKNAVEDYSKIELAKAFLSEFPDSSKRGEAESLLKSASKRLENSAKAEFSALREAAETYYLEKNYAGLLAKWTTIAIEYEGTEAAKEAERQKEIVKEKWKQAVDETVKDIEELAEQNRFDAAARKAEDLLKWCHRSRRKEVQGRLSDLLNKGVPATFSGEEGGGEDFAQIPEGGNDNGPGGAEGGREGLSGEGKEDKGGGEELAGGQDNPSPEEDDEDLFPKEFEGLFPGEDEQLIPGGD